MGIKSAEEIYGLIEHALEGCVQPQTCADLMLRDDLRQAALAKWGKPPGHKGKPDVQRATNKVSDALGFMWRRALLQRWPAPAGAIGARFAYTLAPQHPVPPAPLPPAPSTKPALDIRQEHGRLVIEFDHFIVTVSPK